jgi:hypothetical protein
VWIIQALVRDGFSQVEVAEFFGRHTSWVCRRLAMQERLSSKTRDAFARRTAVAHDGAAVVRLPQGNQAEVLDAMRREVLPGAETSWRIRARRCRRRKGSLNPAAIHG